MGLALLISFPLGVSCAIFLNESRSRLRRTVRIFVDAMSGMPSIVSGLFIYATLIIPLAKDSALFGFNGFMASLALSVTMMPTICRAVEVVLRLVPDGLREAGLALGSSRARVVWSVVLPTASSGVATGAILGIAREAGETAPLLFTAFGYNLMNANPFKGPQESLPLFIYRFIREPSSPPSAGLRRCARAHGPDPRASSRSPGPSVGTAPRRTGAGASTPSGTLSPPSTLPGTAHDRPHLPRRSAGAIDRRRRRLGRPPSRSRWSNQRSAFRN